MTLIDIAIGFAIGTFVGIGAALFYLRWKMKRQLGNIEEQMGAMMDLSEEMGDMMPDEETEEEPGIEEVEEREED